MPTSINANNNLKKEIQFKVISSSKIPASSPKSVECWVLPQTPLLPSLKWLGDSSRWTPEALEQLKDKWPTSRDFKGPKCFDVNFSNGASSRFFMFSPTLDTYSLQTELRKAFIGFFQDDASLVIRLRIDKMDRTNQARLTHAFSVLALTAPWEPINYQTKNMGQKTNPPIVTVEICSQIVTSELNTIINRAKAFSYANNQVRSLADMPANELHPKNYRKKIEAICATIGIEFEFLDFKKLTELGAGAFTAVNRADSTNGSGIAHLVYKPKKTQKQGLRKLALVGKGLCFDTGGYNIKSRDGMLGMHRDMTGSAIALSLIEALATLKVDFEVHAWLAIAENLISATAYRPNEVVRACDGTSIEVVDTDAEGRMVLADTLALVRRSQPDLVIDFATLTYTAMRALDTRRSAIFSNRDKLADLAVRVGDQVGERTWSFPLSGDYREELKSKIADLLQCSASNHADHIYAASFLAHFIGEETPWVHVDLSAAENKGGLGIIGTDTTGFGVFWAAEFIERARKSGINRGA